MCGIDVFTPGGRKELALLPKGKGRKPQSD